MYTQETTIKFIPYVRNVVILLFQFLQSRESSGLLLRLKKCIEMCEKYIKAFESIQKSIKKVLKFVFFVILFRVKKEQSRSSLLVFSIIFNYQYFLSCNLWRFVLEENLDGIEPIIQEFYPNGQIQIRIQVNFGF